MHEVLEQKKPVRYERYNETTKRWYDLFYFPYTEDRWDLFRDITEQN
jgi:hypothetical protein